MKNIFVKVASLMAVSVSLVACSNSYFEDINTDKTKPTSIDPNAQLTTALLQTYGDFSLMDTYRCYITGFPQYCAGGWNVSYYGGAVHADNDMMSRLWDEFYMVGIKNLVDAIDNSKDMPYVNAALRIQRVYMMSILTDTYGDVPCLQAGYGKISGISNPAYDEQKDIYKWFFKELADCIDQVDKAIQEQQTKGGTIAPITGDVTSMSGNISAWMKFANSLRMRFAMRVSDAPHDLSDPERIDPVKEFTNALNNSWGYVSDPSDDVYVNYIDGPFTLYDGARDLDFRVNALGETLYGQDPTSPSMICHTMYTILKNSNDPRLYRICRYYINTKRSQIKADKEGSIDVTEEVVNYLESDKGASCQQAQAPGTACYVGAAWYSDWINAPANEDIPTLAKLVAQDPEAGYDKNNYNARMMRPWVALEFEQSDCPGVILTSSEAHFLLAEAKVRGWNVPSTPSEDYSAGIRQSMEFLNNHYGITRIQDDEISKYISEHPLPGNVEEAIEAINTQAWIHHFTNPSEGWANLRRSDYPVMDDRAAYIIKDFTSDSDNLTTPLRLKYPALEVNYNKAEYEKAVARIPGGVDDWHQPVWWDAYPTHVDHTRYGFAN